MHDSLCYCNQIYVRAPRSILLELFLPESVLPIPLFNVRWRSVFPISAFGFLDARNSTIVRWIRLKRKIPK